MALMLVSGLSFKSFYTRFCITLVQYILILYYMGVPETACVYCIQ